MNKIKHSKLIKIQNQRGLHARAAAKFVEVTNKFNASIQVSRNGQTVSGRSIMGLMMLSASLGSEIKITAIGVDAEMAVRAICKLVESKFYED